MKKAILTIYALISTMSLTACNVNWFGSTIDVPWWLIVIPLVLIFVVAHVCIVKTIYECPECHNEFRPKWYEISSWVHLNGKRIVRCPKCNRRGFCKKK